MFLSRSYPEEFPTNSRGFAKRLAAASHSNLVLNYKTFFVLKTNGAPPKTNRMGSTVLNARAQTKSTSARLRGKSSPEDENTKERSNYKTGATLVSLPINNFAMPPLTGTTPRSSPPSKTKTKEHSITTYRYARLLKSCATIAVPAKASMRITATLSRRTFGARSSATCVNDAQ